jgi:integrase
MLHRALKDAVAWDYLAFNPAEHASLPRISRAAKRRTRAVWTVDDLAAWLRVALTDRFAGMWVLAATSGMRRSELAGAQRDMLDLDNATLTIEDTRVVVDGKAIDSDGKSDSGWRVISLDAFTVSELRTYLATLDEERAAFGTDYPTHGRLMCFEDGRTLHPDTITRRFNRLVDRAGVPRIRLHDVRHTYATLAMDSGIDPKIVSDRVGHSNMAVTLQIYTHRSSGRDRAAAEHIGDLIRRTVDQ